jgi:hypothetical protein
MRSKLVTAVFIVGLLASTMTPTHAIFGWSQCEKVHKQVKALDNGFIAGWNGIRSTEVESYPWPAMVLTGSSILLIEKIRANDPIPKIWKIGYNNPKCFTNTQNLQIKTMKNKTMSSYFDYNPVEIYSRSAKCVKLYKQGKQYDQEATENCITSRGQRLWLGEEPKSIYSY